jgi:serine/threonine protein kinase
MRLPAPSARAEWGRCIARAIRASIASSPSRSSRFATDPGFQERFEREARSVAALNHPRICTLHDVGHQDGTQFLVMELVEGETLAERLLQGALPIGEALTLAEQIAMALEAAHERGILHRDLKPANIKVTPAGSVKVLDFGLAKVLEGTRLATTPRRSSRRHVRPLRRQRASPVRARIDVVRGAIRRRVVGADRHALFDVARNGTLAYIDGGLLPATTSASPLLVDRSGTAGSLKAETPTYVSPRFSPDGSRFAHFHDSATNEDIWIYDLARQFRPD